MNNCIPCQMNNNNTVVRPAPGQCNNWIMGFLIVFVAFAILGAVIISLATKPSIKCENGFVAKQGKCVAPTKASDCDKPLVFKNERCVKE